ncbi:hypothetical protein DAI22_03g239100 [Oryza sativa Japonica Group]|nr:hypothetical protein DAI22_03g239100 [Oryza sativa Japonica Group]
MGQRACSSKHTAPRPTVRFTRLVVPQAKLPVLPAAAAAAGAGSTNGERLRHLPLGTRGPAAESSPGGPFLLPQWPLLQTPHKCRAPLSLPVLAAGDMCSFFAELEIGCSIVAIQISWSSLNLELGL